MSPKTYTLLLALFACSEKSAPRGTTIEVATDDNVRSIAIDRDTQLSSLISVAPAKWFAVVAETEDDRSLEIPTPITTYPTGEIVLSKARRISVVVDGQPIAILEPITRVTVWTHAPSSTLTVDGRETQITGERALVDVIGKPARSVRIVGDRELVLQDFANAVLKRNQRGEYVLRVWDNNRKQVLQEVRRVTKIHVE